MTFNRAFSGSYENELILREKRRRSAILSPPNHFAAKTKGIREASFCPFAESDDKTAQAQDQLDDLQTNMGLEKRDTGEAEDGDGNERETEHEEDGQLEIFHGMSLQIKASRLKKNGVDMSRTESPHIIIILQMISNVSRGNHFNFYSQSLPLSIDYPRWLY
jgi:hypothetical protein